MEVKLVLNFLEIVGSGGIQKIVSNGREYLENRAGDRIKKKISLVLDKSNPYRDWGGTDSQQHGFRRKADRQ